MKVSIILPTYNAEKTIDRCITSIISQTVKEWELICCDDLSTDNTYNKLINWANKDSRILVYRNSSNQGAAYTRNQCINVATGEYIMQIDDDDYCAVDRIEKQLNFLKKNKEYAFVGSIMYYFDEKGIWKTSKLKLNPEKKDFLKGSMFSNPSVMFKTEVLKNVGGYRIAKETKRGQDYDLFMRLYAAGYKGYNIQEPLTFYYRGSNSYVKCKYIYRIHEAIIRYKNFKNLGLLPEGILFVFKPLIVGLIPIKLLEKLKK